DEGDPVLAAVAVAATALQAREKVRKDLQRKACEEDLCVAVDLPAHVLDHRDEFGNFDILDIRSVVKERMARVATDAGFAPPGQELIFEADGVVVALVAVGDDQGLADVGIPLDEISDRLSILSIVGG